MVSSLKGALPLYRGRHAVELKYDSEKVKADISFEGAIEALEEEDVYEVENTSEYLGLAMGATDDYDELENFVSDMDLGLSVKDHRDFTDN